MSGRYNHASRSTSPPRRSSLTSFRPERRENDARGALNRSDSAVEVRTPVQDRLRRLQSNLKEQQLKRGGPTTTPNTPVMNRLKKSPPIKREKSPPTPMVMSPPKRALLKRRIDQNHNDVDMENTTKKSRANKSPSPSRINRRLSQTRQPVQTASRLELAGPAEYENDIEMTDATIQEEISSLRESTTVHPDYSLSMTINAENRLVIKYKDFNQPDEKASSLQQRLMSRQSNADTLHIVVDTNIFIKDLSVLPKLMERKFPDNLGFPILVIPYIVLKELENLAHSKRGKPIEKSAREANKFINNQFSKRNPQFKGQKATDHGIKLIEAQSGDDDVLNCCLQVKESGKKVILLSNDVNLRNKALFNDVPAFSIRGIEQKELKLELEAL